MIQPDRSPQLQPHPQSSPEHLSSAYDLAGVAPSSSTSPSLRPYVRQDPDRPGEPILDRVDYKRFGVAMGYAPGQVGGGFHRLVEQYAIQENPETRSAEAWYGTDDHEPSVLDFTKSPRVGYKDGFWDASEVDGLVVFSLAAMVGAYRSRLPAGPSADLPTPQDRSLSGGSTTRKRRPDPSKAKKRAMSEVFGTRVFQGQIEVYEVITAKYNEEFGE